MTQVEQAKLDAICAEAFARLDAIDAELYQRGFIGRPQNSWAKPSLPKAPEAKGKASKADGPEGGESVTNPHPAPTRPSGGANVLDQIRALQRS